MRYNFKYLLVFGYTGEYQGGYNDLVYLRARHYAPNQGRFLTRDTWAGDVNRPGSLNRWAYVEANPVNFVDPTGMMQEPPNKSPYRYYCQSLYGKDREYCEKIIRGLNPLSNLPISMVILGDYFDVDCLPLYRVLDKPTISMDVSQSWGFWFHYLENEKSRRRSGQSVSISKVIALALSAEANVPALRETIKGPMANAMITKGRALGMYAAIGSRSVVRDHLKPYLFFDNWDFRIKERNWPDGKGGGCGKRWITEDFECSAHFEQILAEYAGGAPIAELDSGIQSEVQRALYEIRRAPSDLQDVPWDWANTNEYLDKNYNEFYKALGGGNWNSFSPQGKTGREEIYYRSAPQDGYGQFFILTLQQQNYWCGGNSCVDD